MQARLIPLFGALTILIYGRAVAVTALRGYFDLYKQTCRNRLSSKHLQVQQRSHILPKTCQTHGETPRHLVVHLERFLGLIPPDDDDVIGED